MRGLWGMVAVLACAGTLGFGVFDARAEEPSPTERVIVVRRGDTLAGLLAGAGIDAEEAQPALDALAPLFPAKALRAGQEIALQLKAEAENALVGLEIERAPGRTVQLRLVGTRWQAEEVAAPQTRMLAMAAGRIDGGLYPAVTSAGLPPGLALSLVRALGHQVDFQRDLQPGDRFSVLFERFRDGAGGLLGHGRVLQVDLVLSGERMSFWRHTGADGVADWYDATGRSLRRAFLRTPLDGARISSGFGMRSHPVLGFTRMHRGTDFAAPSGTPVYAAGDGVVVSARIENGYGRLVRIRHRGGAETRYAHLSRFARGLTAGRAVRQGDVIGAVGSSGLATGPHLHYEVAMAGREVDPARQIAQSARLDGRDLAAFLASRQRLATYAASIGPRMEVAMAD